MTIDNSTPASQYLETLIGKRPTLGDYLLAIRQGEELSQIQFAKQLGISKQNLCDIEHNRRFVSPKMASGFADQLGLSRQQFVRLCLQDLLNRDGIPLVVDVKNAA